MHYNQSGDQNICLSYKPCIPDFFFQLKYSHLIKFQCWYKFTVDIKNEFYFSIYKYFSVSKAAYNICVFIFKMKNIFSYGLRIVNKTGKFNFFVTDKCGIANTFQQINFLGNSFNGNMLHSKSKKGKCIFCSYYAKHKLFAQYHSGVMSNDYYQNIEKKI